MNKAPIMNKLLEELNLIPDNKIINLYNIIHSYRISLMINQCRINYDSAQKYDNLYTKKDMTIYSSLEEGYKAMASDTILEKKANDWISDECGDCLPEKKKIGVYGVNRGDVYWVKLPLQKVAKSKKQDQLLLFQTIYPTAF